MMIEQKRLTEEELYELIEEAPLSEKQILSDFLAGEISAYEYFDKFAIEQSGIISDGRPIYFAAIVESPYFKTNEFWTIANSNIENSLLTMCKICKREIRGWADRHGDIYATMETKNPLNIKWTRWLGFEVLEEDDSHITFILRKEETENGMRREKTVIQPATSP